MAVDEAPWTAGLRGTSPGAKAHLLFCGICGPTKVVPFLQNLKPVLYFVGLMARPCPFYKTLLALSFSTGF